MCNERFAHIHFLVRLQFGEYVHDYKYVHFVAYCKFNLDFNFITRTNREYLFDYVVFEKVKYS